MELTESTNTQVAAPHLDHLDSFTAALKNYHLSSAAQHTLNDTAFTLLVGPSSSGRNTIINRLLTTGKYHFIISDTTRPPRVNNGVREQDGVEYWFRNEADFLDDLTQGKFLEAEVIHGQQVSGISIRELEKAHDNYKIAITDIDIGGVLNVVQAKPDTAVILIVPPSFAVWKQRLQERSTMHDDEYRRRMQTALRIFETSTQHDYFAFVVNDDFEAAVAQVDAIAHGHIDAAQQTKGAAVVRDLIAQFAAELQADVPVGRTVITS